MVDLRGLLRSTLSELLFLGSAKGCSTFLTVFSVAADFCSAFATIHGSISDNANKGNVLPSYWRSQYRGVSLLIANPLPASGQSHALD